MFDIAYFFDVNFEYTSNKAIEIYNNGLKAGGLKFSESVQFVFYYGAAQFAAVLLSTHGSY